MDVQAQLRDDDRRRRHAKIVATLGPASSGKETIRALFRAGVDARAYLPHPEIFAALKTDANLLLDDGKIRLQVVDCGARFADTRVVVGGMLSERKGVNVPDVVLPLSPLTAKDREDLEFALA